MRSQVLIAGFATLTLSIVASSQTLPDKKEFGPFAYVFHDSNGNGVSQLANIRITLIQGKQGGTTDYAVVIMYPR